MDAFLMSDARNNVSFWDVPVLYGESGDILVTEIDKRIDKDLDPNLREIPSVKDSGFTAALRLLKDEEQKRSIGLQKARRETLPVLHVKGSFYEVGFRIGRTFSTLIRDYIEDHGDVKYFLKLYETPKGKDVFRSCFDAVSRTYPEYIRELRGIADGSKIPFHKLFLLHMEDVMLVATSPKEDKPPPQTGSTTLIVTNDSTQLLGHVVDHGSLALGNIYLVNAQITECVPEQEFTALCIGGMLPGSTMAFNAHGMVFVADPVNVRKCNECGILTEEGEIALGGRHLLLRRSSKLRPFLKKQLSELNVLNLVTEEPFTAFDSRTFTILQITIGIEIINNYTGFQFLSTVQEKIHQQHANWILSKVKTLTSHDEKTWGFHFPMVLGDSSINSLDLTNIYSSVESRGMVSVAVGIFDFIEETWSLYLDNPAETQPIIVIPIMAKELGMVMSPTVPY